MADSRAGPGLPVVVALGSVDPALVTGVLDGHCRFVADPGEAELVVAAGAIVRADARVDQALLGKAPGLQVIARTGVGVDLVDVAGRDGPGHRRGDHPGRRRRRGGRGRDRHGAAPGQAVRPAHRAGA